VAAVPDVPTAPAVGLTAVGPVLGDMVESVNGAFVIPPLPATQPVSVTAPFAFAVRAGCEVAGLCDVGACAASAAVANATTTPLRMCSRMGFSS